MIIYFADRALNLKGQASTSLPGGFRIYSDMTIEDVDTGVNTFECKILYNSETRQALDEVIQVGNFIIKGGGTSFEDEENTYDSVYQIIATEYDTQSQELYIYAEDAGLDLINKVVPAKTYTDKTITEMLRTVLPSDWDIETANTPTTTLSVIWDGENTATERINSICNVFGCECFYSFEIERFQITKKILNVVRKRGEQTATAQLRLNKEINKIVTKASIADMATALAVTGGTPKNKKKPINLKGYSYSYTDPDTGDKYAVDPNTGQMRNKSAMARWGSALDSDGLILKRYSYDTTSKAELAGQARYALQNMTDAAVNYEIELAYLPDGINIGDRVNLIDEEGELYLEGRLLRLETSVSDNSLSATFGEFLIKDSGISDTLRALAEDIAQQIPEGIDGTTISITSSGGNIFHNMAIATTLTATIFNGPNVITNQLDLESIFGEDAQVQWYDTNEQLVGTGFTLVVSSAADIAKYTVRLDA